MFLYERRKGDFPSRGCASVLLVLQEFVFFAGGVERAAEGRGDRGEQEAEQEPERVQQHAGGARRGLPVDLRRVLHALHLSVGVQRVLPVRVLPVSGRYPSGFTRIRFYPCWVLPVLRRYPECFTHFGVLLMSGFTRVKFYPCWIDRYLEGFTCGPTTSPTRRRLW